MSLRTRSHQPPPKRDNAITEKDLPPDDSPEPEPIPDASAEDVVEGEKSGEKSGDKTDETSGEKSGENTASDEADEAVVAHETDGAVVSHEAEHDDPADRLDPAAHADEPDPAGTVPDPAAHADEPGPARTAPDPAAHADEPDPARIAPDPGWRGRRPVLARAVAHTTTGLAAVLVFFALLLPNHLTRLTPGAFVRIPVEAIFGAVLLLVLPPRARRAAAVLAGAGLGLLTILKFLDMGFYSVLNRPFDVILDWILFDDAEAFLRDSVGPAGALGAVVGVVLLVVALLVLMALAVVRLSRVAAEHSARTTRGALVLGTVWITCTALGLQIGGTPLASEVTARFVEARAEQVNASLKDHQKFAEEASVDAFRDVPPDQLLTGLRGKNVMFVFIESYGRSAIEDPGIAPGVDKVLADGNERLRAAGFSAKSGFLGSPTSGGGSWLAHSTFASGLWIKNQQRYRTLTSSDRLTLTSAFKRTDAWRTVGVMPGVTRSWPEGKFYGLDNVYDSRTLGYQGPKFSWTPVPDQYSLSAFERLEHGKPGHKPLMAEIILASSHNPWAPLPKMIGWDEVGDGSVYDGIKEEGKDPKEVWKDPDQVRTEYGNAIQYSLNSLVSYVEKYGDDDTVLVFLGDHQPVPTVTQGDFGRDVPISIVSRDKAVLDRVSDWGWEAGLKPSPKAPVWRMDSFRDRFLTAYGPKPGASPAPAQAP
ncbi:sulfatase [Streptomyces sp. NPDC051907]|uniref:sulfatase n=1 Tax=Streptomyces sp. NPDC051907 TaxID=3155284 RepID=UPI003441A589